MRIVIILLFALMFTKSQAQVLAYDFEMITSINFGNCFDLDLATSHVRGHQANVTVTFHETLAEANNNTNPIKQIYTFSSGLEHTIFARVSDDFSNNYATSSLYLEKTPFGAPGLTGGNDICDLDGNGSEQINLEYLINIDGYNWNGSGSDFCESPDSELWTKHFATAEDALNEVNEISPNVSVSTSTEFYRKTKNTVTGIFYTRVYYINYITCDDDTADSDNDGIMDKFEDPNQDYIIGNDDTDLDGLKNFEDDDDDGDGVLTIDEDYNGNGDPTDDDINGNFVPDYLENSVTLNIRDNEEFSIHLYPNPAKELITITTPNNKFHQLLVFDILGKPILTIAINENTALTRVPVSELAAGLYLFNLKGENIEIIKKVLVK